VAPIRQGRFRYFVLPRFRGVPQRRSGSGSVTGQPDTRKRGNWLTGRRRFLAAGRLGALGLWVYRQRGGAPGLNRGKMGRMQAASGKGLCERSARSAGRVWRDGQ
jgi:hypothetical protein